MKKDKLGEVLKKVGLKKTKHRILLLDLMHQEHDFLSADDLFTKAKEIDSSISLSTVYRILESFVENGLVDPITLDHQKQLYYELKHTEHSHHLICRKCQKVIHVKGCPVHRFEDELADEYHFKIEKHRLEFYGLCEDCKKSENKESKIIEK